MDAAGSGGLQQLYNKHLTPMETTLGGEGDEAMYGSLTQGSFDELWAVLRMLGDAGQVDLTVPVDIGSGLCRPLFHAAVQLKDVVKASFGVEICLAKCVKAFSLKNEIAQSSLVGDGHLSIDALPQIIHVNVEKLESLAPATHIIAVWQGMNPPGKAAIGKLFRRTPSLRGVTVVQHAFPATKFQGPVEFMADLGFGEVELLKTGNMEQEKLTVSQTGSRRTLQSYTFRKAATNQEKTPGPSSLCLSTAPGFDGTRYLQGPTTTRSGRELAQLPPPRARRSCRSPAEQQQQQEQHQGRERSRSSTRARRG